MRYLSGADHYHNLYSTAKWARIRQTIIARDGGACQWPGCGVYCVGGRHDHDAAVIHHKTPHKGDTALFFDPDNLMLVCKGCHDGPIQAHERCGIERLARDDGWRP